MASSASTPYPRLRSTLRTLGGVLGGFVLFVLGATVLAATGRADRTGSVIALFVIVGAFALLHWGIRHLLDHPAPEVRVRRHLRACRLALGYAAFVEFYLMMGLPVPASLRDLPAILPLLITFLATVAAAVLLRRSARVAHVLLVALSAWGIVTIVNLVWSIASDSPGMEGPAYAIAILLVICMVVATWYALWTFRRVRPLLAPDAASGRA